MIRTTPRLRISNHHDFVHCEPISPTGSCPYSPPPCSAGPAPRTPAVRSPAAPNIVLIVSDDQGYGDSTAYWDTDLQTPTIDGIARNGVRFTRFRVNPLCAPTRASFMTGLHSLEAGMWRGPGAGDRAEPEGGWPANARRIRDNLVMLPQLLKGAGYATGMFGKWHLGEDPKNVPNARGFDEFVGFLGGAHPYRLGRNSRILHNGKPLDATGQHTTDLFADARHRVHQGQQGPPLLLLPALQRRPRPPPLPRP